MIVTSHITSALKIKQIAMRVINLLQDYRSPDIVVTLGVLWLLLCEVKKVKHSDVLTTANKILRSTMDDQNHHQLRAIKEYMKHEL